MAKYLEGPRRLARQVRSRSFKYIYPRWPSLHNAIFFDLRRKAVKLIGYLRKNSWEWMPEIFASMQPEDLDDQPLVSIIVPCYNHAKFLQARLDSIAGQTYANTEVILLDDGSSDGSRAILEDFFDKHQSKTRIVLNEANSGKPFAQWSKGLELARGELVWIAESDDYCELDFVEKLIPTFRNRGVMLAVGRSSFVSHDGEQEVWSLEQYLPGLGPTFWKASFIETTQRLVERQWATRNLVPNASGCIFRKPAGAGIQKERWWQSLRICGDWLFYLDLARGGLVAYEPEAINYYRQHPANSSVNQHGKSRYFEEHLQVAKWISINFLLSDAAIRSVEAELQARWRRSTNDPMPVNIEGEIQALPSIDKKPNILIVTYALVGGGGEIFPIRLANGLRDKGYSATILNCDQKPTQAEVMKMVNSDVPVLTLQRLQDIGQIINHFSINIIHTHHAWVDTTVAELLDNFPEVKQVITSHGMYDYMDDNELKRIGRLLHKSVQMATYVSETNRAPLEKLGLPSSQMVHINNATKIDSIVPFDRQSLAISSTSFVICLVSRAIREKGWREAIDAVCLLRDRYSYEINLLLVGDGPVKDELIGRYKDLPFIHFLGFRPDTCNLFAGSDLGILPSYFMGESQPLTLIESLLAGTPYVASNLGDIPKMLSCDEGLAGHLIPIRDSYCNPIDIAESIRRVLDGPQTLEFYRACAKSAAKKFSWDSMLLTYEQVYKQVLDN